MTVVKLTDKVWYGNWEAPRECAKEVGSVINVAHHFRASRGRDLYWSNLQFIPHTVPLFRLSLRDKDEFTMKYAHSMARILDIIRNENAFPLLTHCQMGGHRGPSAAVYALWYYGGMQKGSIDTLYAQVFPKFNDQTTGRYCRSMLEFCRKSESI